MSTREDITDLEWLRHALREATRHNNRAHELDLAARAFYARETQPSIIRIREGVAQLCNLWLSDRETWLPTDIYEVRYPFRVRLAWSEACAEVALEEHSKKRVLSSQERLQRADRFRSVFFGRLGPGLETPVTPSAPEPVRFACNKYGLEALIESLAAAIEHRDEAQTAEILQNLAPTPERLSRHLTPLATERCLAWMEGMTARLGRHPLHDFLERFLATGLELTLLDADDEPPFGREYADFLGPALHLEHGTPKLFAAGYRNRDQRWSTGLWFGIESELVYLGNELLWAPTPLLEWRLRGLMDELRCRGYAAIEHTLESWAPDEPEAVFVELFDAPELVGALTERYTPPVISLLDALEVLGATRLVTELRAAPDRYRALAAAHERVLASFLYVLLLFSHAEDKLPLQAVWEAWTRAHPEVDTDLPAERLKVLRTAYLEILARIEGGSGTLQGVDWPEGFPDGLWRLELTDDWPLDAEENAALREGARALWIESLRVLAHGWLFADEGAYVDVRGWQTSPQARVLPLAARILMLGDVGGDVRVCESAALSNGEDAGWPDQRRALMRMGEPRPLYFFNTLALRSFVWHGEQWQYLGPLDAVLDLEEPPVDGTPQGLRRLIQQELFQHHNPDRFESMLLDDPHVQLVERFGAPLGHTLANDIIEDLGDVDALATTFSDLEDYSDLRVEPLTLGNATTPQRVMLEHARSAEPIYRVWHAKPGAGPTYVTWPWLFIEGRWRPVLTSVFREHPETLSYWEQRSLSFPPTREGLQALIDQLQFAVSWDTPQAEHILASLMRGGLTSTVELLPEPVREASREGVSDEDELCTFFRDLLVPKTMEQPPRWTVHPAPGFEHNAHVLVAAPSGLAGLGIGVFLWDGEAWRFAAGCLLQTHGDMDRVLAHVMEALPEIAAGRRSPFDEEA